MVKVIKVILKTPYIPVGLIDFLECKCLKCGIRIVLKDSVITLTMVLPLLGQVSSPLAQHGTESLPKTILDVLVKSSKTREQESLLDQVLTCKGNHITEETLSISEVKTHSVALNWLSNMFKASNQST
jgi:hypothetical protein